MGYPELDHDEPIILESRNVKFKSISFDAILTNKRIHLTDSKKNVIPSQDIPLSIIRNVETGENAIRDHFLILSLVTDAGVTHQVVLTFARQAGVERKRECNEWAKKLKSLIPVSAPVVAPPVVPASDRESLTKREVPTPTQGTVINTRPAKKKIEIARQKGTIIEKSPETSQSEETPALTSGSFCTRCGNRVPLKSTFCNSCGRPITQPSEPSPELKPPVSETKIPVPPRQPKPLGIKEKKTVPPPSPPPVITKAPETVPPPAPPPVITKASEMVPPPAPQPVITKASETVPPPSPPPVITKASETVPPPAPQPVTTNVGEAGQAPAGSAGERQDSSISRVINSIKPPINDSVNQQQGEPSSKEYPAMVSPQVVWPVFPHRESTTTSAKEAAPAAPVSPSPPSIQVPDGKRPNYLAIGILIMAILPILAGLIIVGNIMSGPTAVPANTTMVTTVPTTLQPQQQQIPITPIVTVTLAPGSTQVVIPPTGVWVRVSYPGTYIGLIGTPGNQVEVNDTGDHLYQIPASERTVAAALQKKDSSGDEIILEVYKNGVMLKREASITPKGIVEILLDIKTL